MAAPSSKSLQDLSGKWKMSKDLTTPVEGTLKIQGFGMLLRKAVSQAPVYLNVTQDSPDQIYIKQSTTAGIPAIGEEWNLDWEWREKKDKVMGMTKSRSRWIDAASLSKDVPDTFLSEERWEELGAGSKLIQAEVVGTDGGWSAKQIWGFAEVSGQRRFVRRTVVIDDSGKEEKENVRIVYDWNDE